MDILYFAIIFLVIIILMAMRKPLFLSIAAAILTTILLYRIPFNTLGSILLKGLFGQATINLILALYSITFLQRMMEHRRRLAQTSDAVNNLFNNRRINAMFIPFLIGFLPSPGAVLIAKPIVDDATGAFLSAEDRTFVTSYYRHISEAFLPTYASTILALQLSGVNVTDFVLLMLPLVVLLFVLGYVFYLRNVPADAGVTAVPDRRGELRNLFKGIWPILLAVAVIILFKLPVFWAVIPVCLLYFFVERFTWQEIAPFFVSAFESSMVKIMLTVMVFKEVLAFSGLIERMPAYFEGLVIPPEVIFALLFFFGTWVAGAQAMITIGMTLAFSTIPDGGAPLLVLLMSVLYMALQISPIHICLPIITEAYGTPFSALVKRTMPVLLIFIAVSFAYYYLLIAIR